MESSEEENNSSMKNLDKLIDSAKENFFKYAIEHKNKEEMTFDEFNTFLNDFFKDDPSTLEKLNPLEIFKEFSSDKNISEREFRNAYKDLKISRSKTKDFLDFNEQ
jgi:hypothetical protein